MQNDTHRNDGKITGSSQRSEIVLRSDLRFFRVPESHSALRKTAVFQFQLD